MIPFFFHTRKWQNKINVRRNQKNNKANYFPPIERECDEKKYCRHSNSIVFQTKPKKMGFFWDNMSVTRVFFLCACMCVFFLNLCRFVFKLDFGILWINIRFYLSSPICVNWSTIWVLIWCHLGLGMRLMSLSIIWLTMRLSIIWWRVMSCSSMIRMSFISSASHTIAPVTTSNTK